MTEQQQSDEARFRKLIGQLKRWSWGPFFHGASIRAAEALGELGGPRAVPVLIEVEREVLEQQEKERPGIKHKKLQEQILKTLGKIGNPEAIPFLVYMLESDKGIGLFWVIVEALHPFGNQAVDLLLESLDRQNEIPHIRSILHTLGALRNPRAFEVILPYLKHPDSDVKNPAATALAACDPKRSVDYLIELLKDEDPDLRHSVAFQLGELMDPRALPALEWVRDHDEGETESGRFVKQAAETAILWITGPYS